PVPAGPVLQGVRPADAAARRRRAGCPDRPGDPGGGSASLRRRGRAARGRHREARQGGDRPLRRATGAGVGLVSGAPVRTQGPGWGGTIKDRSVPGRRAFSFGPLDVPVASVPAEYARATAPGLPEVAEVDVIRHYTRLSQMNYGVDTGAYPLGSCTMKYNPKVAEEVAAFAGFRRAHPLQPDQTMQGALEMLWRLERALCEITGMARATLQPPAGACGEMTGLLIMRAYHAERRSDRTKVLIPDSAHGTNPASVHLGGFEAVPVPSDPRGMVDVDALAKLMGDDVAGLMLTNPNTLGLF